jgi:hypothetical protein
MPNGRIARQPGVAAAHRKLDQRLLSAALKEPRRLKVAGIEADGLDLMDVGALKNRAPGIRPITY